MKFFNLAVIILFLFLSECGQSSDPTIRVISKADLRDKIAGGWAGKILGVTYGAPTEFRAMGHTFEDSIRWTHLLESSGWNLRKCGPLP